MTDPTPQVAVVPKFNRNPVASLRIWGYTLDFAGEQFEFPALPASDWLALLMNLDMKLTQILPGMLDEADQNRFLTAWMHGDGDLDELFCDLLEEASGRHWWITMRLVSIARNEWERVGADLLLANVDPEKLSLAAWLDAFTLLLIRSLKPEDANMLMMQVEMVPEGETLPDEEMEMSAEQFLSFG